MTNRRSANTKSELRKRRDNLIFGLLPNWHLGNSYASILRLEKKSNLGKSSLAWD